MEPEFDGADRRGTGTAEPVRLPVDGRGEEAAEGVGREEGRGMEEGGGRVEGGRGEEDFADAPKSHSRIDAEAPLPTLAADGGAASDRKVGGWGRGGSGGGGERVRGEEREGCGFDAAESCGERTAVGADEERGESVALTGGPWCSTTAQATGDTSCGVDKGMVARRLAGDAVMAGPEAAPDGVRAVAVFASIFSMWNQCDLMTSRDLGYRRLTCPAASSVIYWVTHTLPTSFQLMILCRFFLVLHFSTKRRKLAFS
jgi:hypothetical protein